MATRLYGLIWKWHFVAGLLACPLIAIVALTGAMYAFQPELERWAKPEHHFVVPTATPGAGHQAVAATPGADHQAVAATPGADHQAVAATPDHHVVASTPGTDRHQVAPAIATPRAVGELVAIARANACEVTSVSIPGPSDRAYTFYCKDERAIFVHPYRGTVLGNASDSAMARVMRVVFDLHWELVLGEKGRLLVEWASSWTILLLVSGAILWWPRGKRRRGGVLYPRVKLEGRQWLRDLHAVLGAYALPVVLVLAASGLMWTIHAGDKRWQRVAGEAAHAHPRSTVVKGAARVDIDAALAGAGIDPATESRSIDIAVLGAQDKADEPYWFYLRHEYHHAPWQIESGLIDAYSGKVIQREGWNDRHGVLATIDQARYSIHVGAILGLPGRIAACLASLILAALCITGPWMWWKRRPTGSLGVPPAARASWPIYVVLAVFGWVLPMVGYTLLAIIALEGARWLVMRNREATTVT